MGTVRTAIAVMGYQRPNERDCCKNCDHHRQEQSDAVGQRAGDIRHTCAVGGFVVSPFGVCIMNYKAIVRGSADRIAP